MIYVASQYPPWQHATLVTLEQVYREKGNIFPDNREILPRLTQNEIIKPHTKKVMQFVQHVKVGGLYLERHAFHYFPLLPSSGVVC